MKCEESENDSYIVSITGKTRIGKSTIALKLFKKVRKPKFKSNIVHKAEATPEGVFYRCIHAVGKLSVAQLLHKTNWRGKKITCKRCRRFLYKR